MLKLIDKLTDEGGPLRVRAIFTFMVGGVYAYLAVTGKIPPGDVKELTLLVGAFYFLPRIAQSGVAAAIKAVKEG